MIKFKLILLILIFPLLNSCATQMSHTKTLVTSKKSFVKILTSVRLSTGDACTDEGDKKCEIKQKPWVLYATGSGSIVAYENSKAILTAAHVCNPGAFGYMPPTVEVQLEAEDRNGAKHIMNIIKFNVQLDICLLKSKTLEGPALKMSVKKPEYGDEAYNISSPLGLADGEVVPLFKGYFFGESKNRGRSFYSIPTIGGSSGSPILNIKGELIGMIHSVHARFHHVAVSVSYSELWNFLESSRTHTTILQMLCPRLGCEQSQIEESEPHDQQHLRLPELILHPPPQRSSAEDFLKQASRNCVDLSH